MVESDVTFGLDQLPLVGEEIPDEMDVKFSGLRAVASCGELSTEEVSAINEQLQQISSQETAKKTAQLPSGRISRGITLDATCKVPAMAPHTFRIHFGDSSMDRPVPQPVPRAALAAATTPFDTPLPRSSPTPPAATPAAPAASWLNVDKTLGPLTVRRLGIGYHPQELFVLTDATIKAGPLSVGVDGLGLGIRLDKPAEGAVEIDGRLSGLSVDYSTPTLEIAGAFLKGAPPTGFILDISGLVLIKASKYSFGAVGAYLRKSGDSRPLLFLFGEVGGEIGGPPPFVLTGLMGGFGYNTSLRVPALEEVTGFPLVAGISGKPSATSTHAAASAKEHKQELLNKLSSLTTGGNAWVTPADGDIWIAAGLTFTLFELIDARALLTVECGGSGVGMSLLGLANATFPPETDAVTYAALELELEAVYSTDTAMLAVDALLSPRSFLLAPACHLTGGFALHCWFDGSEHPGDFVLSLGGYHPQFTPPAHYPTPARLGINWAVSSTVSITGNSYLALTPSAFMVGNSLDIRYHSGSVCAWLTAHIDALIQWKPFHFDFTAGIALGASLNTHIFGTWTAEAGADMHLWGPPTGGRVTVYILGIGLTVGFGEPATAPDPKLDWKAFTALLPSRDKTLQILPTDGLLPPPPTPIAPPNHTEPADVDPAWVFSSHGFTVETRTAVPASELTIGNNTVELPNPKPPRLCIRPMHEDAQDLTSQHRVVLMKHGANSTRTAFDPCEHNWTVIAQRARVPSALWGRYTATDHVPAAEDQLVSGQISGVRITTPPPTPGDSVTVRAAILGFTSLDEGTNPLGTSEDAATVPPAAQRNDTISLIRDHMAAQPTVTQRTALFDALTSWNLTPGLNDDLTSFARDSGRLFANEPLIAAS
ncbi:DUF6603 domain-containing protein [Streptomyces noursei]|uniref:DUF6603 domain-containing protein n=1 Tax=Streptomyces noursei TaxID=1971 RepID=UPI001673FA79|nr:DUF6603 domain-containing protein [Streptomyces noursei]MCZ1021265.1 hypothetical protein [Streptomyces noursei]